MRPLRHRTCSTIGLPTAGGVAVSARSTNGFHAAYASVSSMTSQTSSRGASISIDADGRSSGPGISGSS